MEELNIAKAKAIGPTKETHEAVRREMLRLQITSALQLYVAPYWYVALTEGCSIGAQHRYGR